MNNLATVFSFWLWFRKSINKVKVLVCDCYKDVYEGFFDNDETIQRARNFSCGFNENVTHRMLVSLCTFCEARLERNDSFLPRECVCKNRSHEICDFCYTLQFKLNFLLSKFCIDSEKFVEIFVVVELKDFLEQLSTNNFCNPKYASLLSAIVGTWYSIAVDRYIINLFLLRIS